MLWYINCSVLSYLGLATDVQTQDDQLLVKENLVDDKKVEEEEPDDEEEDGENDFLQNFPNFYSMAADIMNQLDGQIPEVILRFKAVLINMWPGAACKKQLSDCSERYNRCQSTHLYKQYEGISIFIQ